MYVHMYACMHVCLQVGMLACMSACTYVVMHVFKGCLHKVPDTSKTMEHRLSNNRNVSKESHIGRHCMVLQVPKYNNYLPTPGQFPI